MTRKVKIFEKEIDQIFEKESEKENPNSQNCLLILYKKAIPDWDNVKHVEGFPNISSKTANFMCEKFIQFDKKFAPPNVMPGGIWINNGFSTMNPDVPDWEIWVDESILRY